MNHSHAFLRRLASRRLARRGFTLVEVMVAMAVFMLVMLTAYQVYERSRESFQRGQNQAELIQSVRVGFEQMVGDVRLAGFEFDMDGTDNDYLNQPDEPIEFMGAHAIIVRGNLDFDETSPLRGREPGLERAQVAGNPQCCPVVTTGNDEIVGYGLGKSDNSPSGSISANFDLTGTQSTADSAVRDATVNSATNVPSGEETVTVSNLELADNPANPPYILYRFYWSDTGTLVRQPLVDNIRSLTFTYYDGDGNAISPVGGADGSSAADRNTRWNIRRVKVSLQGMEPERDLRYVDYSDTNQASRKKRKFLLEADVTPPNLGRRGIVDKSLTDLEPVSNVAVCVGQCGFVRVSWEPSPAGPRVIDHVVNLYSDAFPHNVSNLKGSFIVPALFDTIPNPDEEYYTWNTEDNGNLVNGTTIYAQVIARDSTGQESLAVESSDNPIAAKRSGVIGDTVRPGPPASGVGSGYDETLANWPNAKRDNSGGGSSIQIVTNALSAGYPRPNTLRVGFVPPAYALNKGGIAGNAADNWTTQDLGASGVTAPMTCHQVEIDPSNAATELRTPLREVRANPDDSNPQHGTVYVFRVSGSDPWNWDEDGNPNTGVTDPRSFVPSKRNLVAFAKMPLAGTNAVTFDDTSISSFVPYGAGTSQYDQRFNGTAVAVAAYGMGVATPKAVTPGEVYYYRFRVVDLCWRDVNSDGVEDSTATDPEKLTAWSVKKDFAQASTWKNKALKISPFYPPLRRQSGNDLDRPDQGTDDSDDYTTLASLDTYALPAYAIPALDVNGNYIKPEKPTELYLARANEAEPPTALLGNGGVRLVFNTAKRTEPVDGVTEPASVGYTTYELHRVAATSPTPSTGQMNFTPGPSTLVSRFRVKSRPDSAAAGPLPLLRYTLDTRDEGAPSAESPAYQNYLGALAGKATDWANAPTNTFPYIYRLVTVQCREFDDGIDTAAADMSAPSPPFLMPCAFYDRVRDIAVLPATGGTPVGSVTATVAINDSAGADDATCGEFQTARLLAFQSSGGAQDRDYLGSSKWRPKTSACGITFNASDVTDARRGYSDTAKYVVEIRNDSGGQGLEGTAIVQGCRVRSGLLGTSAPYGGGSGGGPSGPSLLPIANACTPDCGNNNVNAAKILGSVADSQVTLEPDKKTMVISVPISGFAGACTGRNFNLMQVEVDLKNDNPTTTPVPAFVSGRITGGAVSVPPDRPLGTPDPTYPKTIGGDSTTMRVRWFSTFTDASGSTNYPTVDVTQPNLVIRLTFADQLCNVRLTALNFRVPYESPAGTVRELLCGRNDDESNPVNYATNPGIRGNGRGPESTPTDTCPCVPTCLNANGTGRCPFNDADNNGGMNSAPDVNITTTLLPIGANANRRVQINLVNNCNCTMDLSYIEFTFLNNNTSPCSRNCNNGNPLPKIVGHRWAQLGLPAVPPVTLPAPTKNEAGACVRNYKWGTPVPLTGIQARPGESVRLEVDFDGAMDCTRLSVLTFKIGGTFPNDNSGNDPSCSPVEPAPSPSNLTLPNLKIPQPTP